VCGVMKEMVCGSLKPYWTCRGLESIVGIMIEAETPVGAILSSYSIYTNSGAHLASCAVSTQSLSWGEVVGCGVEHQSPSNAKVRNQYSSTSSHCVPVMACNGLTFSVT
jgi:hypothetical protein